MARRPSLLLLVVLVPLLNTSRLDAQRALSGTVRDAGGSLLPRVSASATGPAHSEPRKVETDQEGRYSFRDLPDGTYTLTFTLPGFVETTHSDIVLPGTAAGPLDVVMRVGSIGQAIVLRGLRGTTACTMRVLPADPSIDQKMLKEPDATRNYTIKSLPPPCQASHPAPAR